MFLLLFRKAALLIPFCVAIFFVPEAHLTIYIGKPSSSSAAAAADSEKARVPVSAQSPTAIQNIVLVFLFADAAHWSEMQPSYGATSESTFALLTAEKQPRTGFPRPPLETSESNGGEPLSLDEEERIRRFRLRPLSMTASFYSATSAPNAMQRVSAAG
jgi:hypothetical protein